MENDKPAGPMTKPMSRRGIPKWITYILSLVGFGYLLYPSLGVFELIPDIIPFVGHLDESVAVMLIWYGLVEFFEGRE